MVNGFLRVLVMVGLVACILSRGEAAQAQDTASAKAHFKSGTTFYDLGKYDDAIREFEAAYEAKSDPAFLFNLAQAHRLAGHTTEALHFYRTYLRYVPNPPNLADIQSNVQALEKQAAQQGPNTAPPPPTSTTPTPVTVPPSPATNTPSGTEPPPSNLPPPSIPPPGPSGAYDPQMGMPPQPPPAPAIEAPSPRIRSGKIVAVIGGAVFATGVVFGLAAQSASQKVEKATTFDPAVERSGKAYETMQWIGCLAGAALVGTGVYMYLTAPRSSEAAPPPAPHATLVPMAGPNLAGALLKVSFQ